jgi:hypothetical protein
MGTRVEHFKVIGERLSNWKRWGADDRRGTLNFISAPPRRVVGGVRSPVSPVAVK